MGGLIRNPASCSVPRHPAPARPPSLPAPFPSGTQGSGPPSKFQSPLTHQHLFPRPGWRLKEERRRRRKEEEDGEKPWAPRSGSLLSLQTELLLDLVAEAQSRHLEEQRATFHTPQVPPSLAPAPPRLLEDKEQLYSTILSHQCQRMEAQRSEPPELLELLLPVQDGGRMEEQRSQPPPHTC
ncbi:G-protein-signaling modulator 3 [Lemmus lemmus]